MNISPAGAASLNAFGAGLSGGWAANTDAQVLAAANAATIANPTPQGTVPTPYTIQQLLACLSAVEAEAVADFPGVGQLYAAAIANDTTAIATTLAFLVAANKIGSTDAAAINAILTATQSDPSYQSELSWAQVHLGRAVDLDDVTAARAL